MLRLKTDRKCPWQVNGVTFIDGEALIPESMMAKAKHLSMYYGVEIVVEEDEIPEVDPPEGGDPNNPDGSDVDDDEKDPDNEDE